MRRNHMTWTVLAVAIGACSGDESNEHRALGPVKGSQIDRHHSYPSGTTSKPRDLSSVPIEAIVPTAGELTRLPGSGAADGTYTIPNVPGGEYTLRVGDAYVVTKAETVDLGVDLLGRPDAIVEEDVETSVLFDLIGLEPWSEGHDLQIVAANAGLWGSLLWSGLELPPGATSLRGAAFTWVEIADPPVLLEAAKGDSAYVFQLAPRFSSTGLAYRSIRKIHGPTSFTLASGRTTAVPAGAFRDTPDNSSVRLSWRRSRFASLIPDVHPSAQPLSDLIAIDAQPRGGSYGQMSSTPDLVLVDLLEDPTFVDLDLGTVSFANPFPSDWALFGIAELLMRVSYALPGASPTRPIAVIRYDDALSGFDGKPIAPLVGPVTQPRVDGANGFVDGALATATPMLAWEAPAVGRPTGYRVSIWRLSTFESSGTRRTRRTPVATLYTGDTRLRIPPQLLEPGGSYFFRITSQTVPAADSRRPFRRGFPSGIADTFTGIFTLPAT